MNLLDELESLGRELGFPTVNQVGDSLRLHWTGLVGLTIQQNESGAAAAAVWVRTNSADWSGDRTDLNDIAALTIAHVLLAHGLSTDSVQVGHPVVDLPGEVYATYLVPRQPYESGFPADPAGLSELTRLMISVRFGIHAFLLALEACGFGVGREGGLEQHDGDLKAWAEHLADPEEGTYSGRRDPTWRYCRAADGLTIVESRELVDFLRSVDAPPSRQIDGPTGTIIKRGDSLNLLDHDERRTSEGLLLGVEVTDSFDPIFFVTDNRVSVLGSGFLVSRYIDCGRARAHLEIERLKARHANESSFLFEDVRFEWAEHVSGARSEELTRALLEVEPGVLRVHPVGRTNEPDGGRDFIVDWDTPLSAEELRHAPELSDSSPITRRRRILVQCKADKRPVNVAQVPEVRDLIDDHRASGLLLVARTSLTRPLVDKLDRLGNRGPYWIEWWERHDLEIRLRRHPIVLRSFGDVVVAV